MTWDEFIATALSLLIVAIARLIDQYVPPRYKAVEPVAGGPTVTPPTSDQIEVIPDEEERPPPSVP